MAAAAIPFQVQVHLFIYLVALSQARLTRPCREESQHIYIRTYCDNMQFSKSTPGKKVDLPTF